MTMAEAYDFQVLVGKLKARGLDNAEKLAAELYLDMKAWLKESAAKSATPFDDMAVNFVDQLDVAILPQIDKINGKEG